MTRKRRWLASALAWTGVVRAVRVLSGPTLLVLNYHRIRADGDAPPHPFDDGVYGPTQGEFDRQMAWVGRNTEVLSEAEVVSRLARRERFGRPSTLVTFDDAYADNHARALPVLRAHRLPALLFVPTGLVGGRRLGAWDVIAFLVKRSSRQEIELRGERISLANRHQATRALVARHKLGTLPHLAEISERCGVPLPEPALQDAELLRWDEIREMAAADVAIGSHTHDHPVLAQLTREEQRRELELSKRVLEAEVGRPVRSLAYPFGGSHQFNEDTVSLAEECGYQLAFRFDGGPNRGTIDRYRVDRYEPPSRSRGLAAALSVPRLFD
jgi:peptidoglycan/xylan/chitin deacetylase (PgdA/CDA1 family)